MPRRWSAKDERQHEHVEQAEGARGVREDRAQEIAGRAVNQQRLREGCTRDQSTQGTGRPGKGLNERTRAELCDLARERRIGGSSSMNKDAWVEALTRWRGASSRDGAAAAQ